MIAMGCIYNLKCFMLEWTITIVSIFIIIHQWRAESKISGDDKTLIEKLVW